MAIWNISKDEDRNRRSARTAVRNALRLGKLVRPERCESDESIHSGQVEAHHFLGYDRVHWLDVRFLCRRCHLIADKAMPWWLR